ncbi:alpha-E domain-containing protein [Frigidibacter sp. ROC022]|uniref:alpha-E domain-containing protein n=1 Tax=Frigidibacter sp. ROC022 TaxID=2971796 RepID=UPI00215A0E24|nr:alpha-E domain-containing protein [Frigidibacter sp. ROC022]MCR8723405.1 alpha-E domain-containing protein [Frigidibacter sp. ROC022]
MLSRTADNLYWIARYLERAETTARLLEVGGRNALMPNIGGGYRNEWDAILLASGTGERFIEKYDEPVQRNIETYMFFDRDNPSSILSCIEAARENARIVRTALTTQVWDAINTAFQEIREMARQERSKIELSTMTDWTTRTSALIRGAILGTLLRRDGFYFLNLGYYLERADNTARLLDVKYYVLLPQTAYVGSGLDNYQWATLLRAMSAYRSFNWAYGAEMTPARIAHFLILNPACPRSLRSSIIGATEQLEALQRGYGHSTEAQAQVRRLLGELSEASVEDIFEEGLHEFLTRFIREVGSLGAAVRDAYLTGEAR